MLIMEPIIYIYESILPLTFFFINSFGKLIMYMDESILSLIFFLIYWFSEIIMYMNESLLYWILIFFGAFIEHFSRYLIWFFKPLHLIFENLISFLYDNLYEYSETFFVFPPYLSYFMGDQKDFFSLNSSLSFFDYLDNMLLVLMLYFVFKSVLLSLVLELIWPTHIFNKKNNFSYVISKKKIILEVFLKFKNNNFVLNLLNTFFIKY